MLIRHRLLIALLIVSLISASGGLVGVFGFGSVFSSVETEFTTFNDHGVEQLVAFSHIKDRMHMALIAAHAYLLTGDKEQREMANQQLNRVEVAENRYAAAKGEYVEEIRTQNDETEQQIRNLLARYDNGMAQASVPDAVRNLSAHRSKVMGFYHGTVEPHIEEHREETSERILASFDRDRLLILLFSLFGLGVAVITGIVLAQSIVPPLQELADLLNHISRGEMEERVPDDLRNREDEIGTLAQSFSRTLTSLKILERRAQGSA